MSRSRRKTPIMSVCVISAGAVKKWRQSEWRSYRSKVKQLMRSGKHDKLPHSKEYHNEWSSPRDGKQHFFDARFEAKLEPIIQNRWSQWGMPYYQWCPRDEYNKWMRK